MGHVFISYRRDDASGHASHLYDHLAVHFGADRVFRDVTGIQAGKPFLPEILTKVSSADVVLAVMGRDWTAISVDGKPRLQNPTDVVRQEIETAFSSRVPVIPILVGGAHLPSTFDLPESLQPLLGLQAVEIDDKRFDHDAKCLIQAVEKYMGPAVPRKVHRSRWQCAAAAMIVVVIFTLPVLLYARIPGIAIALEAKSTEVSFTVSEQQMLFQGVALRALGVSGLERITLPDALDFADSAIRIQALAHSKTPGSIIVPSLKIPQAARVWVQYLGSERGFRVSIRGKGLGLQVNALGALQIDRASASSRLVTYDAPEQIRLYPSRSASDEFLDLDLSLRGAPDEEFSRLIKVTGLSFTTVENALDLPRMVSSIINGTLSVDPPDGRQRELRAADWIRFKESTGEIHTLRLSTDGIAIEFRGYARGMRTGSDAASESLMPTYWEWLTGNYQSTLLLGFVVYAATLLTITWRWRAHA